MPASEPSTAREILAMLLHKEDKRASGWFYDSREVRDLYRYRADNLLREGGEK